MQIPEIAMNTAQMLGADYADIRLQETRRETITLRNLSLKGLDTSVISGYGIRVMKNGAWGFAHSNDTTPDAVKKTTETAYNIALQSARVKKGKGLELAPERSYIDKFVTPHKYDPFNIPAKEKIELMLDVNKTLLSYKPIVQALFLMDARKDIKLFANTEGSRLDLTTIYVEPRFTATAVNEHDSQSRMFHDGGFAKGYEAVYDANLPALAPQIAEQAIQKVNAETLSEEKRRTLILDPCNLALTMHESVGHPTELDRVLGWEADMAGLSFATPEKLKNFRYGSEIINFWGDNTLSDGIATAGYDDDGVPAQKWLIIKDGILNEYGTTRDTARFIGENFSRGCCRATHYYDFPINRIPNLYLAPGTKTLSPQELIADTEDGIYIENRGSFSIDQHRVNFQFGGDLFWEIKNGKKNRMLKKVLYKSHNPEFWNSCDAICDERYWKSYGITNCGKGQPPQTARMTHGAATARFRNIRVGGSK